jgi:hypothetical protein
MEGSEWEVCLERIAEGDLSLGGEVQCKCAAVAGPHLNSQASSRQDAQATPPHSHT